MFAWRWYFQSFQHIMSMRKLISGKEYLSITSACPSLYLSLTSLPQANKSQRCARNPVYVKLHHSYSPAELFYQFSSIQSSWVLVSIMLRTHSINRMHLYVLLREANGKPDFYLFWLHFLSHDRDPLASGCSTFLYKSFFWWRWCKARGREGLHSGQGILLLSSF